MPRQARQFSHSGYLHIILRGIGRQSIFEDDNDYERFLNTLWRFCRETDISVCAYCLMENHAHLLIRDETQNTSLLMKKLGVSYSRYFNKKYDRVGHLFQDRYLSEAIEDEVYLLAVFRYILNNPVKAGICPASTYPWSSYALYDDPHSHVDSSLMRELIGDSTRLDAFLSAGNSTVCMDHLGKRDENWARDRLCIILNVESGTVLQSWDRAARNEALQKLKRAGLSIRQIERLTGISRNIIQRA